VAVWLRRVASRVSAFTSAVHDVSHMQCAVDDANAVRARQARSDADQSLTVADAPSLIQDLAGVRHLAARFEVERRVRQRHVAVDAGRKR